MKACLILVLVGVAMMGPRVDAAGQAKCIKAFEGADENAAAAAAVEDCGNAGEDTACSVTFFRKPADATKKYKWDCLSVADSANVADDDCKDKTKYTETAKDSGIFVCKTLASVDTHLRPAPKAADFPPETTTPVVQPQPGVPPPPAPTGAPPAEGSGNSFKPGYLPFVVAAVVVLGKSFVAV